MKWVSRFFLLATAMVLSLHLSFCQKIMDQTFGLESGLENPELLMVFKDHKNRIIAFDANQNAYSFENGQFSYIAKQDYSFIRFIPHYCFDEYCLFFRKDHILKWQNDTLSSIASDTRGQGVFAFTAFRDTFYEVRDRNRIRYFDRSELELKALDTTHTIPKILATLPEEGLIYPLRISDDKKFVSVTISQKGKYLKKYNSEWEKVTDKNILIRDDKLFTIDDQMLTVDSAHVQRSYDLSELFPYNSHRQYDLSMKYENDQDILFRFSSPSEESSIKYLVRYKNMNQALSIDQTEAINIQNYEFFDDQKCLLATHEGLHIQNINIKFFDSKDPKMISSLHVIGEHDGNLIFGSYGSGISMWNGISLQKKSFNSLAKNQFLPGYTKYKGIPYFLIQHFSLGLLAIENDQYRRRIIVSDQGVNTVGFYLDTLHDGRIGIGTSQLGFAIIDQISRDSVTTVNYDSRHNLTFKNVLCFAQDRQERVWIGHPRTGIGILDLSIDQGYTHTVVDSIENTFGGFSMEVDKNGDLWVGSREELYYLKDPHLYAIDEPDLFSKFVKIDLPDGSNSIITVLKQVENYIVIGNQSSISFINLDKFDRQPNKEFPIYQYLYDIHIPGGGTEQNAVLYHDGQLWIGCHFGALQFDFKNLKFNSGPSQIEYKKGISGELDILLNDDKEIILSKDNRNCKLKFGLVNDPNIYQDVYFTATVTNHQQDTIFQQPYALRGEIDITYLPPGKYDLDIQAYRHGLQLDNKTYRIITPAYLSERPWFWILLIGLPLLALSSFIFLLGRQRRKVLQRERDISILQAQTDQLNIQRIVNSFNPHFINNSLHWIQSRYRKDDKLVKVVGRLSENIYAIFQQTIDSKAVHNISDEITFVINYLDIQQVRFDQRFTYTISDTLTKKTKSDLEVILMQIQIHVENAIEHGIQNSDKKGVIKISLEENSKNIIIKIEDNGIGRQEAKMLESKGTGNGTAMLNELHEIFNEKNITKLVQQYEDGIFTDTRQPYGTRVIITIPKDYNYGVK